MDGDGGRQRWTKAVAAGVGRRWIRQRLRSTGMTTVDESRRWTAAASVTMEMTADGGCEDHRWRWGGRRRTAGWRWRMQNSEIPGAVADENY